MRVLLVDDEEDLRKIGKLSLERVGRFETIVAAGGQEAIDTLRGGSFDVVLMDLMMPQMDGLSALGLIRADVSLRDTPVIFVTAKVNRTEIERYLAAGAIGVIEKPFDPMTLPRKVTEMLALHQERKAAAE
ncbi:response regulator [Deltaproteobacteria bacterium]|nr:response regulator [Deltaproteobacteria bacterium]